jgi:glycerol kinase
MNTPLLLSIDQGTTSSRAILFDPAGNPLHIAQEEFPQHYPRAGWVEHDPEAIWSSVLKVTRDVLASASATPAAIGITNQRETTLMWDRATGEPIHNAIVWQDRRTAGHCDLLRERGFESSVMTKTGLLLDPYFSATKIAWILNHVDGARARAEKGELAFGTVDTFLLWRLTGGRTHATDATNASRTALFNIHSQDWDEDLLNIFDVPRELLPEVRDTVDEFGLTDEKILGASVPIHALVGDQQAALVGQACIEVGALKSTYGTGCFAMLNTGSTPVSSKHRLLTTVAYRINRRTTYALEGSLFMAGASVQWLRDGLGIIASAEETEALAASLQSNHGVYLVPAFTGLGAPHWNPNARGTLLGMTRDTGRAHIARAALESICYQTEELLRAMSQDFGERPRILRIDGGMARNNWMAQFLSDITQIPVERPALLETTALGAARLAGLGAGLYDSTNALNNLWHPESRMRPTMNKATRDALVAEWSQAVTATIEYANAPS